MSSTLSKIEKRTAYTLLLPAVCLVFAIILFPIFANVWISFKEVGLKGIRIPEPRVKKIVKNIQDSNFELKIELFIKKWCIFKNKKKIYLVKVKPQQKAFFLILCNYRMKK